MDVPMPACPPSSGRTGKVDLLKDEQSGDEMDDVARARLVSGIEHPFSFKAFQTTSFRSIPFVWMPIRTGKVWLVSPSKAAEKLNKGWPEIVTKTPVTSSEAGLTSSLQGASCIKGNAREAVTRGLDKLV